MKDRKSAINNEEDIDSESVNAEDIDAETVNAEDIDAEIINMEDDPEFAAGLKASMDRIMDADGISVSDELIASTLKAIEAAAGTEAAEWTLPEEQTLREEQTPPAQKKFWTGSNRLYVLAGLAAALLIAVVGVNIYRPLSSKDSVSYTMAYDDASGAEEYYLESSMAVASADTSGDSTDEDWTYDIITAEGSNDAVNSNAAAGSDAAEDSEAVENRTSGADSTMSMTISNPYQEADETIIESSLGYRFTMPAGADSVTYYIISGTVAEFDYTISSEGSSIAYTARICADSEFEDISGMYYDWSEEQSYEENGRQWYIGLSPADGTEVGICLIFDAGSSAMYSLSAEGSISAEELAAEAALVFGLD